MPAYLNNQFHAEAVMWETDKIYEWTGDQTDLDGFYLLKCVTSPNTACLLPVGGAAIYLDPPSQVSIRLIICWYSFILQGLSS